MHLNDLELKEELNFSSLLKVFIIHKRFIITFILITVVLSGIYSFIVPEEYEAVGSVIPPEEAAGSGGLSNFLQSLSGGINIGGVGQSNKLQLYQEFLKSREVAKYVVDKCKLRNNPKFKDLDDLSLYHLISFLMEIEIRKSGLIVITTTVSTNYFPSKDEKLKTAQLSSDITNAAIEGLDKLTNEKSVSKARKKRKFIERMLVENKFALDSVDNLVEQYQKEHKILAIDDQTQAMMQNASSIGSDLAQAEIEMKLKLQEFEYNSPQVRFYREKVNNLQEQYNRIQSGGLTINDKFSIPFSDVPQIIKQYTTLLRDQKILEQVKLYLETQRYQEAIQEESDVSIIETLDKAIPPIKRSSPSRLFIVVLGLLLSSVVALSIVTFLSIRKGRLYLKDKKI